MFTDVLLHKQVLHMDVRCLLCFVAKMALNQYDLLVLVLPDHGLVQQLSKTWLRRPFEVIFQLLF